MKNRTLDTTVGGRLALFMRLNGFTDAVFAKQVSAAPPTVATWRNGTRPYPRWREALRAATGWDWNDPESIAALTDLEVQEAVDARTSPRAKAKAIKVDKANPEVLTFGSFAGLTVARDGVTSAIAEGRALDPAIPADALVLNLCAEALQIEASRRMKVDEDFRSANELRVLVLGHRDPQAFIAFLRTHVDAKLLALVERSLPTELLDVSA